MKQDGPVESDFRHKSLEEKKVKKVLVCLVVVVAGLSSIGYVFADESVAKDAAKAVTKIGKAMPAVGLVYKSATGELTPEDVGKTGVMIVTEAAAVPVAVATASTIGTTAGTGTAIATLSGAAATSATLAAIGGPASGALAVIGIPLAPAIAGGAIVVGVAGAVGYGINRLLFH